MARLRDTVREMLWVTPRSRALHILVVEDHPGVRQLIVLILEQAGHLVDDVANTTEALAHLRQVTYDLVLSDQLSGVELAQQVRRHWPDVRFILATGLGSRIAPQRAAAAGIDALLAKPFCSSELRELVWQVCAPLPQWREYRAAQWVGPNAEDLASPRAAIIGAVPFAPVSAGRFDPLRD